MHQTIIIIFFMQIPVILSIIIIGIQANTLDRMFKFLNIAWGINLVYIILNFISKKYRLEIYNDLLLVTFSDMLSMFFFFKAIRSSNSRHPLIVRLSHISNLRLFSYLLIASLIRLIGSNPNFDYLDYINEYSLFSVSIDFLSLYLLSTIFKEQTRGYSFSTNGLQIGFLIYAYVQFLALVQYNSWEIEKKLYLESVGFGIGLFSKFLILIGLSRWLAHKFRDLSSLDKDLTIKKAFGDKLNQILGRTFHEITPPLLEIEKTTHQLNAIDNQIEIRLSKKAREEVETIESAVHRMRTILTASLKMYHSDSLPLNQVYSVDNLPLPIDSETDIHNINTLIQIAIVNFKTSAFHELHEDFFVTDKVKFYTDYAGGCNIECNSVQMVQIFYNLFKNSYEAIADIDPVCRILIKTKNIVVKLEDETDGANDRFVIIEVEDNGTGIPNDIIEKVFEQGFSTKSDTGRGRGFGLEIVKSYTHENGGTVSVESPIIKSKIPNNVYGTKFIFSFPKV